MNAATEEVVATITRSDHPSRADEGRRSLPMKTLIDAARQLVARYESMPDGDLGRGLTNGDFFALRDALKVFEQGKNVDTPTSHLRNAQQILVGLSSRVGDVEFMDVDQTCIEDLRKTFLAVDARIRAALEQLEGKPL